MIKALIKSWREAEKLGIQTSYGTCADQLGQVVLALAWPCKCGIGYMPCYEGWLEKGKSCCGKCDGHSAKERQTRENENWPLRAKRGELFP